MSQETDDFDSLEALLTSARNHADKMRERSAIRRVARTRAEVSQDYAERLAEKATFRRLLSDEALDGVRFRWLWKHWERLRHNDFSNIEALRAWVDWNIALEEEKKRG